MNNSTSLLIHLINNSDLAKNPDLYKQCIRALTDYFASLLAAKEEPSVKELADYLQKTEGKSLLFGQQLFSTEENAALFNGFCSHYLDLDDTQANLRGHLSTVLFSALFAVARPEDKIIDLFNGYIIGTEVESLIGKIINSEQKENGWHLTGILGSIGAAAAIATYKKLNENDYARILSLAATQSSGMEFQFGTDAKPLNSGFAARNAVWAFHLTADTSITANTDVFNDGNGWLTTISKKNFDRELLINNWLNPGQLIEPGLWMKRFPFCSAAMCGHDAAEKLFSRGYTFEDIDHITIHFSRGADKPLKFRDPDIGQEGKFSIEYILWQVFSFGEVKQNLFANKKVPESFKKSAHKFTRVYDLPQADQAVRQTKVTIVTQNGRKEAEYVTDPSGSPKNPLSLPDIQSKLAASTDLAFAEDFAKLSSNWPQGIVGDLIQWVNRE